ncbi:hypothetical protein RFI_15780 [Reticulomyxa filosa]|uniref:acylphosphatase n=1 Tax=Reticulomyxa filosa TaxID=46433 RepID=X6N6R6_RETFI|nr:hypothetical protein RFI_15780 [Reticulomyxa filosa]|eukprot:ETO21424.1 hypothetical protein RFI_15780 [Reticulomyxa filosa]
MASAGQIEAPKIVNLRFEVKGVVQGVSFRELLKKKCDALGVCGWVQNTSFEEGSVLGELQGTSHQIDEMKCFLAQGIHDFPKEKEKSKKLKVEKYAFEETPIEKVTIRTFLILDHFRLLK